MFSFQLSSQSGQEAPQKPHPFFQQYKVTAFPDAGPQFEIRNPQEFGHFSKAKGILKITCEDRITGLKLPDNVVPSFSSGSPPASFLSKTEDVTRKINDMESMSVRFQEFKMVSTVTRKPVAPGVWRTESESVEYELSPGMESNNISGGNFTGDLVAQKSFECSNVGVYLSSPAPIPYTSLTLGVNVSDKYFLIANPENIFDWMTPELDSAVSAELARLGLNPTAPGKVTMWVMPLDITPGITNNYVMVTKRTDFYGENGWHGQAAPVAYLLPARDIMNPAANTIALFNNYADTESSFTRNDTLSVSVWTARGIGVGHVKKGQDERPLVPTAQPLDVVFKPTSAGDEHGSEIPAHSRLKQNYPNPFNSSTSIMFDLPKEAKVTLTVYGIGGNVVANLLDKQMPAGSHSVNFNAQNLPSGVYIYSLKAGNFEESRKMVLLK